MPKKSTSTKKRTVTPTKSKNYAATKFRNGSAATKHERPSAAAVRKAAATKKRSDKPAAPAEKPKPQTKAEIILGLLRRKGGASIAEMAEATGWQAHSVRGLLSGTVKKKLGLKLVDEKPQGGARRYFVRAAS